MGGRSGLDVRAGSGRTMSSMICSISASAREACSRRFEDECCLLKALPACLRIFINEAGVAGSLLMASSGADFEPFSFPARYGDRPADPGLGVAGGGMRASDRDSGDTDSASELS